MGSEEQTTREGWRGMRRAKREVTDPGELRAIVERARVLRVGFVDDEGMAIVPMNFGVEWVPRGEGAAEVSAAGGGAEAQADAEDDGAEARAGGAADGGVLPTFWLHSADEGRKADAWATSPQVALELDVEGGVIGGDFSCAYSFAYASVMAWGRVRPVTDAAEKLRGLEALMAHMAPEAPVHFSEEAVARVSVWRVDVERLTGKRREGMPLSPAAAPVGEGPAGAVHAGPQALSSAPDGSSAEKRARGKKGKHEKHGKKAERHAQHEKHEKYAGHGEPEKRAKHADKHEDGHGKKHGKKAEAKALEERIQQELAGERCPGCGHHCKLVSPRCGKGRKIRGKRLAKAGLA